MSDNDVFLQIKKWCMEDRVYKLKKDQQGVSWIIELSYPFNHPQPVNVAIINPSDTDFVLIQVSMLMSPQHLDAMVKKGTPALPIFYSRLRFMFLQKDVGFNIDAQKNLWQISEQIHFDGLSKNDLFKAIRHIYNVALLGNMIIDEVLQTTFMPVGKKGGGPGGKEANGTGGTFYQ